ncbi:FAD-dependent monooxygenase [Nonomuraea sp. NPDC050556]|uniref:FAD-dependent monooxygenase n=1 Tax=Nonomuraea sp. NPDC050556 TaxID=3364369 RepID=UPI0037AADE33
MTKNANILISGASIAGTSMAYWLRRYGFTPTVVERAPAIREGGYKVDIRGAALEVVERMGVMDAVLAGSTEMTVATHYDAKGRKVATMDAALFGGREGADAEIMRGDLNEIFYDLTKDSVEYLFDDSIATISDDGVVTFESGLTRKFDLVIGADGAHSNTRRIVFGDERQFAHDLGYYVSICSVPNHLGLDREEAVHVAPGRTANVYSTKQTSGAKALFLWASEPLDYNYSDVEQQKKLLADAMAGVRWEVPKLLESVRDSRDFYFDSLTQIKMDRWSKGRVALVGDAAYCASPASGQGTSLAIVGAYVLAGELAAAAGDHEIAFDAYQREMAEFVEANQKLGPANVKGMVIPSKFMVWFTIRMLKLMPHMPGKDGMIERITGPIRVAANSITLKNYVE